MATSQLGNHCKSKREGDIKGMNDEERKGGAERDERREVKTKRKGEDEEAGGREGVSFSFYLLTVLETLRQRGENSNPRFKMAQ